MMVQRSDIGRAMIASLVQRDISGDVNSAKSCCGSGRSHKRNNYAPAPHPAYQTPYTTPYQSAAPPSYSNNKPQFARFDVSKGNKGNEDTLPAMPSWDNATSHKVEVEDDPDEHEMEHLDPQNNKPGTHPSEPAYPPSAAQGQNPYGYGGAAGSYYNNGPQRDINQPQSSPYSAHPSSPYHNSSSPTGYNNDATSPQQGYRGLPIATGGSYASPPPQNQGYRSPPPAQQQQYGGAYGGAGGGYHTAPSVSPVQRTGTAYSESNYSAPSGYAPTEVSNSGYGNEAGGQAPYQPRGYQAYGGGQQGVDRKPVNGSWRDV
ncbi:MAG: hypothetical protein M1820_004179 [Bogoriella megaspora]|nr:MAG: hypothetical protein M1820_004179 [Bogoriella megaspora]